MKFVEIDGLVTLASLLTAWMESKEAEAGLVVVLKVRPDPSGGAVCTVDYSGALRWC